MQMSAVVVLPGSWTPHAHSRHVPVHVAAALLLAGNPIKMAAQISMQQTCARAAATAGLLLEEKRVAQAP